MSVPHCAVARVSEVVIPVLVCTLCLLALPARTAAQERGVFQTTKLADGLYELSADAGGYPDKVVASVGPDGLLLVDSGAPSEAKGLAQALAAFGKGLPKIIINTHSHLEHLGGNPDLGKGAVVIGHRNVRERYLNGLYFFGNFPPEALPNLTFTDSLTLHFNGEEIRLASFTGGHDSSDIAVWFTKSKVVVVGAICMGKHFPSLDGDEGDITRYPEVAAKLLAWLPEDVRLVPGHADDCDMAQARGFLDMLRGSAETVGAALAQKKTLAQMKSDKILARYASFESAYVAPDDWLELWYDGLSTPKVTKPRPYAPVIQALKAGGASAAMDTYEQLRKTQADTYFFDDMTLMYMGRRLSRYGHDADAIIFLNHVLADFPGGEGALQSHLVLATISERQGQLESASEHVRTYLKGHPESQSAAKRLADLETKMKEKR